MVWKKGSISGPKRNSDVYCVHFRFLRWPWIDGARLLVDGGHEVTLHARNTARAEDARRSVPQAKAVAVGDLSSIEETRRVAEQVNALGRHDAVIHNAGVGYREARRIETVDGLSHVFAVNALAPYLLTALITPPDRLVYLSSGMHVGGDPHLRDPQWAARRWNGAQAYSDSKLLDVVLAFAVARLWRSVLSNALEPGWVPTKMGGPGAPDDLSLAPVTQVWLAVSDDPGRHGDGPVFLPSAAPPREPGCATHGSGGRTAQLLRRSYRRPVPTRTPQG